MSSTVFRQEVCSHVPEYDSSNRFSAGDNNALGTLSADFRYANLIDLWRERGWRFYSVGFERFIRPTWNIYCLALDPVPPPGCPLVKGSWVSTRVPVEWSGPRCCVWRGKLQPGEHGCCNPTCMMPCVRHFLLPFLFFLLSLPSWWSLPVFLFAGFGW